MKWPQISKMRDDSMYNYLTVSKFSKLTKIIGTKGKTPLAAATRYSELSVCVMNGGCGETGEPSLSQYHIIISVLTLPIILT